MKQNSNFQKLENNYLFATIGQKVAAYKEAHPGNRIISMGIGDVTRPLAPAVITAMSQAVTEMGAQKSFHGYPSAYGEAFLRQGIQDYYAQRGVSLALDEIYVGDGAKSDIGNIVDLFDPDNVVLIPDPVYPVYVDTNVMSGRAVRYVSATAENGFLPVPPADISADIIYLCSPNNPTGAVYDREGLEAWVTYALEQQAVILFDAAYEAFITGELPRSIFEIQGAKKCAIEFCSFSKTAGFTGVRCGYTVISHELVLGGVEIGKLWARRQATKFNGVSYITQRGAAAVFTPQGQAQIQESISYYRENAAVIAGAMEELGVWFTGGTNSPYIWLKTPQGLSSWEYFDKLLNEAQVVGTPGSGFGKNGEGYFRLTAFGDQEATREAVERLKILYQKGF